MVVWIPSHMGIHLSELADELAKRATEKMHTDIVSNVSIRMIKYEM